MTTRTILCLLCTFFIMPTDPAQAQRTPTAEQSGIVRTPRLRDQAIAERGNNEAKLLEQIDELEAELTRRRSEHRLLITDLRTVLETAKTEKARQTQKAITDLINKKIQQHTERTRRLEQRLQRFKTSAANLAKRRQAQHRVGTVAPKFSLNTFNGEKTGLSEYQDKVVVLEWINPECPVTTYYYRKKTTTTLADKYARQGVVWLSVNSTLSQDDQLTTEFIDTHNITHPVLNDAAGEVARLYYVQRTPHIVIIDRQGKIAYSGAIDNALPRPKNGRIVSFVDKALTELLAGGPVTLSSTNPTAGTPINPGIRP